MTAKPRKRRASGPPPPGSRSEQIVELARKGWTAAAIAKEVGRTKGSVRSMLVYYEVGTGNPTGRPPKKIDSVA